jgi:PAS domain S-box-containing protein
MLIENNHSESHKFNLEIIEILIFLIALLFVFLLSIYSYLLFHTIAELFSIIIAGGIFLVGWNSRKYMENSFFLVIGVSSLFIAIIDLIHTLAYSGMNIFIGYTANLPTSLWIVARYLQAGSCLLASILIKRMIRPILLIIGYLILTFILLVLILSNLFPICYVEGTGLTLFKKISEYVIDLTLFVCLLIIFKNRDSFDKKVFSLIVSSILATIIAELAFTFYIGVYDFSNFIGHIFKIIAFYLLYKSIIQIGIEKPFNLLFRKIRKRELELKNIITHSGTGIVMMDENGQLLLVNEKAATDFGGIPESFIGKTLYDIFPKELAEEYYHSNLELIKKGINRAYQRTFNLPTGRKTFWIVEQPIKDIDGKSSYLITVATDITERTQAEERLSQLVSTVSHELRTPITVLLMSMDYLTKHKETLNKQLEEKLMEGISRNISLLNELAEDILIISRIDENKLKLEFSEFSPIEVIKEILNLMEPIGKEKNVEFEVNVDETLRLVGDHKRIEQIFRIIIDNAIKYSNQFSKVEILATNNYIGKYNKDNDSGILFQFKDYGRGIPKEDLTNIFERFFRASNVNEIAGTGLGLAIAKDLIQAHKGKIFIESELDKGTTFYVFLPYLNDQNKL